MIQRIRALFYALLHRGAVNLTIVRRYADAKGHFIGELYLGNKMIGMSCDSLPLDVLDASGAILEPLTDFTEPMCASVVRIGGMTPEETAGVRADMALRRYCRIRWAILNRFIEHIMEVENVGR